MLCMSFKVSGDNSGESETQNDDITVPLLMMQTWGPKVSEAFI